MAMCLRSKMEAAGRATREVIFLQNVSLGASNVSQGQTAEREGAEAEMIGLARLAVTPRTRATKKMRSSIRPLLLQSFLRFHGLALA